MSVLNQDFRLMSSIQPSLLRDASNPRLGIQENQIRKTSASGENAAFPCEESDNFVPRNVIDDKDNGM